MVQLIKIVIENEKGRGLRQGGSLSPLLLNLYLDKMVDLPWAKRYPDSPLVRYADDLLVLTRDLHEAQGLYEHLGTRLLAAGMPLKRTAQTAITELPRGQTANWIGYALRKGLNELEVRPTESSWELLRENLVLAHTKPEAPIRAIETIEGLIAQLGPCRPWLDPHSLHARVASLAIEQAFEEIPTIGRVTALLESAHARWLPLKERAAERMAGVEKGFAQVPHEGVQR
jgi:hypothetical protein